MSQYMTRPSPMRPTTRPGGRNARPRNHTPRLTAPALLQMSGQPEQPQCQPITSCGPPPCLRGFSMLPPLSCPKEAKKGVIQFQRRRAANGSILNSQFCVRFIRPNQTK